MHPDCNCLGAISAERLGVISTPVQRGARTVHPRHCFSSLSWQWLAMLVVIALAAGAARAQKPPTPRAYDVCSVKPSPSGGANPTSLPTAGGGFTTIKTPTVGLVSTAFNVRSFQIVGLPGWAMADRYDVTCKDTEAPDAKQQPMPRMRSGVQALLAERFQFQYHRGSKRLSTMTLKVGKRGAKLTPSKATVRGGGYGPAFIDAKAWSMAELASVLTTLTGEKVIDKTGLAGRYDFDLEWVLEDRNAEAEPGKDVKLARSGPLLADALSERLGLTTGRSMESTELIIVDHIEKPAAN